MLKLFSDTTFIFGAGAHCPYGMKTAMQLTETIKSLRGVTFSSSDPHVLQTTRASEIEHVKLDICRHLVEFNIIPDLPTAGNPIRHADAELNTFIDKLTRSQVYSIDAYLAKSSQRNDPEYFTNIGRFLIAYLIEKDEDSFIGSHKPDWIQFILNRFLNSNEQIEAFFDAPPKFFTFNYDNLFERSIYAALIEQHGFPETKALTLVKSLNVTHIYGHTNSLILKTKKARLDHAFRSILVIGDSRNSDELKQISITIGRAINSAKTALLMGFGFDDANMDLLFSHCHADMETSVYSTSFELDRIRIAEIQNKLSEKAYIRFPEETQLKCNDLLRHREVNLFEFSD